MAFLSFFVDLSLTVNLWHLTKSMIRWTVQARATWKGVERNWGTQIQSWKPFPTGIIIITAHVYNIWFKIIYSFHKVRQSSIFLRGQSLDTGMLRMRSEVEKMKRRSAGAVLLNPRPSSLSHHFFIAWKKFRVQTKVYNLLILGLKRWTVVWWWSRIVLGRWISRRGASPRWPAGPVVRLPAPGLRLTVVMVMIMHVS